MRDAVVAHMEENELYSQCQHGFRKGRSCISQLLEVMDDFTKLIDKGEAIDVVYLDFAKAFDTVPHRRLLLKLDKYGIAGKLKSWIEDFLSNRVQVVKVGKALSSESRVISGIPQGSILGPILFTIFINDLPDKVLSVCKVFADDTKIYNSDNNTHEIQQDLDGLMEWSDHWDLHFNATKCNVMHIGSKNRCNDYVLQQNDTQSTLASCDDEKDLGVIFDKGLTFDKHINTAINKANKILGIIRRTFTDLDVDVFMQLYKGMVRPHLEYGNQIWHPYLKRQSIAIERVQRRATKLVNNLSDLSYRDRLTRLNLPSLKYRRLRGDLITTYKLFTNPNSNGFERFFSNAPSTITRNNTGKIYKEYSRTNIRKFSFSNRVIDPWNCLPTSTKTAKSLNIFKSQIDKYYRNYMFDHD